MASKASANGPQRFVAMNESVVGAYGRSRSELLPQTRLELAMRRALVCNRTGSPNLHLHFDSPSIPCSSADPTLPPKTYQNGGTTFGTDTVFGDLPHRSSGFSGVQGRRSADHEEGEGNRVAPARPSGLSANRPGGRSR